MPYLITSDQLKIYYEVITNKPIDSGKVREKLILINGLSSPISYWLDVPSNLSQYFDVLIYDHRGIGKSDSVSKPYTVDRLQEDLEELVNHLHWQEYHLFGVSLGGFVCLKHAEKNRANHIKSLTLVSTHPGLKYLYYPMHNPYIEFIKWKFLPKEKRIKEIILFNSGSNLEHTNLELYKKLYKSRLSEKVSLDMNFWLQAMAGSLFWGINYKKIKNPVLIVHGKNDRVVPYQNAIILSKLLISCKKVSLHLYENAGHLCLWEKEEEIIKTYLDFIDNLSESSNKVQSNYINTK
jgi:pimeloyl-ACP methyl ester carboxylesterase